MLFYVVFITICMENPNYAIFVDESLSTNIQHSLTMGSSLDILELLTIHSPQLTFSAGMTPFHSLQTQKTARQDLLSGCVIVFYYSYLYME
jgi:hypothetical protein